VGVQILIPPQQRICSNFRRFNGYSATLLLHQAALGYIDY
jgi:hypothetical protein